LRASPSTTRSGVAVPRSTSLRRTSSSSPSFPAPFTQADWPNPRRAARPVELHPQLYVGLFPVGPKPFAQTDWPNPLRSHAVSDWSWPIVADQAQPPIIPPHDCSFVAHALTPVPLTASALTVSGLTAKPLSSDTLTAPPPNEDC
jgi:hypothetical protein